MIGGSLIVVSVSSVAGRYNWLRGQVRWILSDHGMTWIWCDVVAAAKEGAIRQKVRDIHTRIK